MIFQTISKTVYYFTKEFVTVQLEFLSLRISVLELAILNLSIGTGNLHSSCTEGVNLANAALQAMACFRLQQRAKGIST